MINVITVTNINTRHTQSSSISSVGQNSVRYSGDTYSTLTCSPFARNCAQEGFPSILWFKEADYLIRVNAKRFYNLNEIED